MVVPAAKLSVATTVMIEILETGEIKLAPFDFAVFDDHTSDEFWEDGMGFGFSNDIYHYVLMGFVLYFLMEEASPDTLYMYIDR